MVVIGNNTNIGVTPTHHDNDDDDDDATHVSFAISLNRIQEIDSRGSIIFNFYFQI